MCDIIERNRAEAAAFAAFEKVISLINKKFITVEQGAEDSELSVDDFRKKASDFGLSITV